MPRSTKAAKGGAASKGGEKKDDTAWEAYQQEVAEAEKNLGMSTDGVIGKTEEGSEGKKKASSASKKRKTAEPADPQMVAMMQQQMMMMNWGMMPANTGGKSILPYPVLFSLSKTFTLTLPSSDTKLGMLLDDHAILGLPELTSLHSESPIYDQIPKEFHQSIIVSLKSGASHGFAKDATECAEFILQAQKGQDQPAKLEIALVQTQVLLDYEKRAVAAQLEMSQQQQLNPSMLPPKKKGKKRGPKSAKDKEAYKKEKRAALLGFFSEASKPTVYAFCRDNNIPEMRTSMDKTIKENKKLKNLVDKRDVAEKRAEAYAIIEKDSDVAEASTDPKIKAGLVAYFSDKSDSSSFESFCEQGFYDMKTRCGMRMCLDKDKTLGNLEAVRGTPKREEALARIHKLFPASKMPAMPEFLTLPPTESYIPSDFFSPENVKAIADNLDYEARPRMSRDFTTEIKVHDRKQPDEVLTLLILDFSNRVSSSRALSLGQHQVVLGACAKILFYDHGYAKVSGVTKLEKTWGKRLEAAYVSGSDTNPLKRQHKGGHAYTEKMDEEYPGLLKQIFDHTEASIGKTASLTDKAMFMNTYSMELADDDPTVPVLKMNQSNLRTWLGLQTGATERRIADKKAALGPDAPEESGASIAQIEKKWPGMVEGLYNFAVAALGQDASPHMLAICMNERAKENVEEDPTLPLVTVSRMTLPSWLKKREAKQAAAASQEMV